MNSGGGREEKTKALLDAAQAVHYLQDALYHQDISTPALLDFYGGNGKKILQLKSYKQRIRRNGYDRIPPTAAVLFTPKHCDKMMEVIGNIQLDGMDAFRRYEVNQCIREVQKMRGEDKPLNLDKSERYMHGFLRHHIFVKKGQ